MATLDPIQGITVNKKQPSATFFEKIAKESKQTVRRLRRHSPETPLNRRTRKQFGIDTDNTLNEDPRDTLQRFKK